MLEEIDFFLGKIQRRLEPRAQANQCVKQQPHRARKVALETALRCACRGCRAAGDEIGDCFGLHQVELAVEEGSLGELARSRRAGTELQHAAQEQVEHGRTAMCVQLDDVFAGVRARRDETDGKAAVDRITAFVAKSGKAENALF